MSDKKKSPDEVFGPKIADNLGLMAEAVCHESGATEVYINANFVFKMEDKKGKLKIDIRVSPDASKERAGNGSLQPRGSKLQIDVDDVLKDLMQKLRDNSGNVEPEE